MAVAYKKSTFGNW